MSLFFHFQHIIIMRAICSHRTIQRRELKSPKTISTHILLFFIKSPKTISTNTFSFLHQLFSSSFLLQLIPFFLSYISFFPFIILRHSRAILLNRRTVGFLLCASIVFDAITVPLPKRLVVCISTQLRPLARLRSVWLSSPRVRTAFLRACRST